MAVDQLETWSGRKRTRCAAAARLLWVHARGFPRAMGRSAGPATADARRRRTCGADVRRRRPLATVDDHDALLLHRAAYAAQTRVLDECMSGLGGAGRIGLDDDTLVVLVGTRGFALGEHGQVGGECRSLYSEMLHVPCLVRRPAAGAAARSAALAQPTVDLARWLEWFGVAPALRAAHSDSASATPRRRQSGAIHRCRGRRRRADDSARSWMLRVKPQKPPLRARSRRPRELFAKPDDRWEANEIADRCPEVANGC